MIKRIIIMLILLALVFGAFAAWKVHAMKAGMQQMMSSFTPPTVSTIKAETQDWQPKLEAIGSLRAVNGADLSSEVAGIVDTLSFDSGADVEKDAVLVHLRDSDDVAKLQALQATAKLAQVTLDRDMKQLKAQAVSQATIDADVSNLNNAKAQADAQEALLDKKTIRAPFAGHLGIRQVDIGQYLNPGAVVVTLQQLDPIYVDFTLPEQDLPKVVLGQKVTLATDAYAGQSFTGKVAAINSKVDSSTRNISVRAAFDNPDHKLLPGMFGHVDVDSGEIEHYITLPQTAIVFNTYGNTVYLIQHKDGDDASKPQTSVKQSVVITGETRGDQVAVLSGVKEGDEVVTSGQVKLRNDMAVVISNDTPAPNDPNPAPHEQ
jgi:membrane fusion protein (multidrug efflux system)